MRSHSVFCGFVVLELLFNYGGTPKPIEKTGASFAEVKRRAIDMKFSEKGMATLKDMEGFKEKPYLDSEGNATIAYGHMIKKGELFSRMTVKDADALIRQDVEPIVKFLNVHVTTLVTQNQFDALVMFIYNIGASAFLKSQVFQDLKSKKFEEATKPWGKWINISKMVKCQETGKMVKKLIPVEGLIHRRAREIMLFNT